MKSNEELTVQTVDLKTTKMMWNSVISTEGARYMCTDIKSFYLESTLEQKEYMKMPLHLFPQKIKDQYDIDALAKGDFVYMEIRKGMYSLPAAGIIANKLLKARLAKKGYFKLPHTPGLWKHVSRPIAFTLVVDDFGVKYEGREHVEHLLAALEDNYTIEND